MKMLVNIIMRMILRMRSMNTIQLKMTKMMIRRRRRESGAVEKERQKGDDIWGEGAVGEGEMLAKKMRRRRRGTKRVSRKVIKNTTKR